MKQSFLLLAAGALLLSALGCGNNETDEAPTGTKSNDKFEMSGEAGADATGGGAASAKAGSDAESGDN